MILSDHNVRVWLYQRPTDMRKSFPGLIGLVRHQLQEDPLSGQLFAFINRRRTHMKVLYYAQGGFCIWMKKLTQGQFALDERGAEKKTLSYAQLQWLVEGIEIEKIKYRKRLRYSTQTLETRV